MSENKRSEKTKDLVILGRDLQPAHFRFVEKLTQIFRSVGIDTQEPGTSFVSVDMARRVAEKMRNSGFQIATTESMIFDNEGCASVGPDPFTRKSIPDNLTILGSICTWHHNSFVKNLADIFRDARIDTNPPKHSPHIFINEEQTRRVINGLLAQGYRLVTHVPKNYPVSQLGPVLTPGS